MNSACQSCVELGHECERLRARNRRLDKEIVELRAAIRPVLAVLELLHGTRTDPDVAEVVDDLQAALDGR